MSKINLSVFFAFENKYIYIFFSLVGLNNPYFLNVIY